PLRPKRTSHRASHHRQPTHATSVLPTLPPHCLTTSATQRRKHRGRGSGGSISDHPPAPSHRPTALQARRPRWHGPAPHTPPPSRSPAPPAHRAPAADPPPATGTPPPAEPAARSPAGSGPAAGGRAARPPRRPHHARRGHGPPAAPPARSTPSPPDRKSVV